MVLIFHFYRQEIKASWNHFLAPELLLQVVKELSMKVMMIRSVPINELLTLMIIIFHDKEYFIIIVFSTYVLHKLQEILFLKFTLLQEMGLCFVHIYFFILIYIDCFCHWISHSAAQDINHTTFI